MFPFGLCCFFYKYYVFPFYRNKVYFELWLIFFLLKRKAYIPTLELKACLAHSNHMSKISRNPVDPSQKWHRRAAGCVAHG